MAFDRRPLSAQIGPVVDARSLAIYRPMADGAFGFEATGFVLDLGESALLVSAGHALQAERVGLIPHGASSLWLRNRPVSDFDASARAAICDVGTVLIEPTERRLLPQSCLTPLSALSTEPPSPQRRLYRVVGYRVGNQVADRNAGVYLNGESVLSVSEASPASYLHSRLDRRELLLLGAKRRNYHGSRGSGGVPSWGGMSGSPVWMVPSSGDPRLISHPFICGLLVGAPEHSRDLILTLRTEVVLRHIERAHPAVWDKIRAAAS